MRIRSNGTRARAIIASLLLFVLTPTFASGCFGGFQLTKKVYQFNRTISYDKWIRWITFLVFSVAPVYGIAFGIDVVFANSIEFWSGSNPITAKAGKSRVAYGPRGEIVRTTRISARTVRLDLTDSEGRQHTLTLVREVESVAALSATGTLLARVADVDGEPRIIAGTLAE